MKDIEPHANVLLRRTLIFEKKIAEEQYAMQSGQFGPGPPAECPWISGETRRQRLQRWQDTVIALKRVIASL